QPRKTSSTRFGSSLFLSMMALITCAARSSGRTEARTPPKAPIGVRIASIMTASVIDSSSIYSSVDSTIYKKSDWLASRSEYLARKAYCKKKKAALVFQEQPASFMDYKKCRYRVHPRMLLHRRYLGERLG